MGISFFGNWMTFFMLRLHLEVMAVGMVSLGVSFSSKNLASVK